MTTKYIIEIELDADTDAQEVEAELIRAINIYALFNACNTSNVLSVLELTEEQSDG